MYTIGLTTITSLPLSLNSVDYVRIENGNYNDVYASHILSESNPYTYNVPEEWEDGAYFHSRFNGDLNCGNSKYGLDNTTNLIIKRREYGNHKWMPLFNIDIFSLDSFNFSIVDPYVAANTIYEYAAVTIVDGEEFNYCISEPCEAKFNNLYIMDVDERYLTPYDISISQQKNNTSSTIVPIQNKYPIYVANASNDYYSGNISATFLNYDCVEGDISLKDSLKLRNNILNFLNNKKPKYIKDPFGRCWIAAIGTVISDEETDCKDIHKISFDFTEIGDTLSNEDMNTFGFLEIEKEWWF